MVSFRILKLAATFFSLLPLVASSDIWVDDLADILDWNLFNPVIPGAPGGKAQSAWPGVNTAYDFDKDCEWCADMGVTVDVTKAWGSSYSVGKNLYSGTLNFTGHSVYMYGISIPHGGGITFYMNGQDVGKYDNPQTGEVQYNVLMFEAHNLAETAPQEFGYRIKDQQLGFKVRTGSWAGAGKNETFGSLFILDYAIVNATDPPATSTMALTHYTPYYTSSYHAPTASSGTSGSFTTESYTVRLSGKAIAGIVTGLIILLGACIGAYLRHRRNRAKNLPAMNVGTESGDKLPPVSNLATSPTSTTTLTPLPFHAAPNSTISTPGKCMLLFLENRILSSLSDTQSSQARMSALEAQMSQVSSPAASNAGTTATTEERLAQLEAQMQHIVRRDEPPAYH
ncbi:hypothetical protein DL96DRAFT_1759777 [Flagelloscypha sp. PMI_526]|nr:hypothetical protein DL96DRAFT_1759777 [Flagelloscypha sp. PMI_526]